MCDGHFLFHAALSRYVLPEFPPPPGTLTYSMLKCPKRLVRFTAAEGADLHCEPKDPGLRDLRVFNWLDEVLGR
jgi:hypothetical protein